MPENDFETHLKCHRISKLANSSVLVSVWKQTVTLVSADGSCQKLSRGTPMKKFPNTMVGEMTALSGGRCPPRRETERVPLVEC